MTLEKYYTNLFFMTWCLGALSTLWIVTVFTGFGFLLVSALLIILIFKMKYYMEKHEKEKNKPKTRTKRKSN